MASQNYNYSEWISTSQGDRDALPIDELSAHELVATWRTYFHRAWDSGTGGWVRWTSITSPNTSPLSSATTPSYTGVLSAIHIEAVLSS